jgi:hypothetical protein
MVTDYQISTTTTPAARNQYFHRLCLAITTANLGLTVMQTNLDVMKK